MKAEMSEEMWGQRIGGPYSQEEEFSGRGEAVEGLGVESDSRSVPRGD